MKVCPHQAIKVRHYADVVPLGASVQPVRGTDSITWTIGFRNGTRKRFTFPIRTTAQGSADPYGDTPDPVMEEIADHATTLFTRATHSCDMNQFIER